VLIFIGRRLAWGVVMLALITLITFVIFIVIPAPDNRGRLGQRMLDNELKVQLNLDGRSLPGAYVHYVDRVAFHADLGYSIRQGDTVRHAIGKGLPVTAALVGGGVLVWLLLAFPIGILSALRPRSLIDKGLMVLILIGISAHPVWVGLMLSYFLGFKLHVFPVSGYCDFNAHPESGNCGGVGYWAYHMVLPWITFALLYAALYARMIRANVLEALNEDYVRTAWAKGAGTARVVRRHVVPNVLLPVVSMLGMDLALAFTGTLFIETVFSLPGLGQMLFRSLATSDRPMIMGIVLLVSAFVVVANLLVDLLHAALDPRIGQHQKVSLPVRRLRLRPRPEPQVTESAT
jgi:peptide/nickel transport system permease protein